MRGGDRAAGRVGFTLVEVVVALTVLTVGMLGLSATVAVVASRMSSSLLETRVRTCAQAELEGMLAHGLDWPASVERQQCDLEVSWQVSGGDLKEIIVVVGGQLAGSEFADTLSMLVRLR
ncbi:MAG: prepilin-type N-terminal cleavage/methylation domain-containing protein [Gemmatimonadota bacterium]|nr:MAG: prepilin-type N-terminal cleavage/methylation domain-containing protein [Gemmatimonadota bacterium]